MSDTARKWVLGGLVVILALTAVGLTVLALQHVSSHPADDEIAPIPTFSQPSPAATVSPSPTETPTPASTYDRSQERFLAVGTGVLWRGVAGACNGAEPLLERSMDGGETWADVTPTYLGIGQLASLSSFAGSEAEIVASMGEGCEVQALRTFTQGQFWAPYDDILTNAQYIDPTDAESVVMSSSAAVAPCADARGLRASEQLLAITCDGAAYILKPDTEWEALQATGVSAVAVSGSDVVVANVAEGCAGLTLTRFTTAETSSSERFGCVPVTDRTVPTSIAVSGESTLVWSGDDWIDTPS